MGTYSAGVIQTFNFGLEAKLAYVVSKTRHDKPDFGDGVESSFWNATPSLELKMPLWGNGFAVRFKRVLN